MTIRKLSADEARAHLGDLANIVHATVLSGGSVNFCLPFSMAEAEAFWTTSAFPALDTGLRHIWVGEHRGRVMGTVMLDVDMAPNQPHRGEVTKLLVHPDARRSGLARALMKALEAETRAMGKTLLTLDTWSDSPAEALYRSLGFCETGQVPGFFLHPVDRSPQPTTYFYKALN